MSVRAVLVVFESMFGNIGWSVRLDPGSDASRRTKVADAHGQDMQHVVAGHDAGRPAESTTGNRLIPACSMVTTA